MKKLGPPKLAPAGVPSEAALYLDNAAAYLTELAKTYDLELKPYDQHQPGHSAWFHGLYGVTYDRGICVQVITDLVMAPKFEATLVGYLRLYPSNGANEWLRFESRHVRGMAGLMTDAADLTDALRLACIFRMPHPTDPDPKA